MAVIRQDIEIARSLGAAGVVLGALATDGAIDRDQTAKLIALARPLSVTFHKAIDQTPEPGGSARHPDRAGRRPRADLGGRSTALEGVETLAELVERAADRIAVMAGGRLGFDNLATIIRQTSVCEVHLGSAVSRNVCGTTTTPPRNGFENCWNQTDKERVAAAVSLVRASGSSGC